MADDEPRFSWSDGAGVPLGSLPCFTTVSSRGAAGKALESALEPLHRIVYGRPGSAGQRRGALESFQGFPAAMEAEVAERLGRLTKDRLRDMIKCLGLAVHISKPVQEVVAGVTAFLMAPKDEGKVKDVKAIAAAKRAKEEKKKEEKAAAESRKRAAESTDAAPAKRAKAETTKTSSSSTSKAGGGASTTAASSSSSSAAAAASAPSEEAVLLEVYRRVLAMTCEERAVLGVKALRTQLEQHFGLQDGALKARKDAITTAASECVRALREAEQRAVAALQQTGEAAPAETAVAETAAAPQEEEAPVQEKHTSTPESTAAPAEHPVAPTVHQDVLPL